MKKHLLPIFLLVLIAAITHPIWFFSRDILTFGDFYIDPIERIQEFFSLPSIWQSAGLFGSINIGLSFWPLLFFAGILAKINIDPAMINRIIYFWPSALFNVISMYILSYYILRSRVAGIISAIVYGFNAPFLTGQTGILTVSTVISIAPFLLFVFMLALKTKKLIYIILSGLIAYVISFYEFRMFYMVFVILVLYIIFNLLIDKNLKKIQDYTKMIILAGIAILIPILLNFHWLLGLGNVGVISSNEIFSRELSGIDFVDVLKSLSLFIWLWTDNGFAGKIQSVPIHFWLIPFFAILGLILKRKDKYVLFFGLVSILGIFLVKQTEHPFTGVYYWLYQHLPGFNAFREPTKFYFYIMLGYSILIGAFVSWIWQNWQNKKWQIFGRYFLTLLIAALFLWNTKPILNGAIQAVFVPRHIPNDYIISSDFIKKQSEYFRTLWIPRDPRWGFYGINHPRLGMISIMDSNWKDFVREKTKKNITHSEIMINILKSEYSNNLLDISSIKYVFVPIQDKKNDDDFFVYGGSRQDYINELDKVDFLSKVDIGTEDLVVYENKNYRPHLYLTFQKETVTKNIPFQNVFFQSKNQTEYEIKLNGISKPMFLNFPESYHSDWKIRIGEFNWFQVLVNKSYFLSDKYHFQNDVKLNSFYIDPDYIKTHYPKSYKQNKDGSIDLKLTLYFRPQSYIYFGFIISSIIFLLSLGYISLYIIRRFLLKK